MTLNGTGHMDFQVIKKALLMETDQVSCFDAQGNVVDCRNSGQDGAFGREKQAAAARFSAAGDIVEDRWTGLKWHKNANLPGFPLHWREAFEYIQEMNDFAASGIRQWQLPSRGELFSLVSHQNINPALPEDHPFDNVFNGYYWTQTSCSRLPNQAWYVHLGGGRVYRGMKHGSYMVWPVAGPQNSNFMPENRFQGQGHLVTDIITKRMWLRAVNSNRNPVTWSQALRAVEDLNENRKEGFSDWRLPNIRELDSLVDLTRHSPAMASGFFPSGIQAGYWSSTTSLYEPRYAWVLYTRDGAVGVGYKAQADFFVLAVR
jgi:hypothetical protein